jgi:hypothetical protein
MPTTRRIPNELYNGAQAGTQEQFAAQVQHWMIAKGKVYVGTTTGVVVFALLIEVTSPGRLSNNSKTRLGNSRRFPCHHSKSRNRPDCRAVHQYCKHDSGPYLSSDLSVAAEPPLARAAIAQSNRRSLAGRSAMILTVRHPARLPA